jgi:L-alanine-DL-glutamate epimerase-like enolase superfamily enzyme
MSTTAICEIAPGSAARLPQLTIREVKTFAVEVPMTYPLGTSAATVRRAPLLLIDLETEEGVTGRTYLFCYRPSVERAVDVVLRDAVALVKGETAAPLDIAAKLGRRFALAGLASVVRMALSALDAAIWDALAVAAGLPLATLLGAKPRPILAYSLQFERLGADVAGGRRRRGREAARWRVSKRETAARPSYPRGGSCRYPGCPKAAARRDRVAG